MKNLLETYAIEQLQAYNGVIAAGVFGGRIEAMAWDAGLTGPWLNIAAYPGTPLRVMAGPGTGKTFAALRRVARLLETGTSPSSILAVSFTRTAANEVQPSLKTPNIELQQLNEEVREQYKLIAKNPELSEHYHQQIRKLLYQIVEKTDVPEARKQELRKHIDDMGNRKIKR